MVQNYKILIIKFGALGDVVRTTYILKGLYEKYQNLQIDWLTSNGAFDLLRFNPYINTLATKDFLLSKIKENSYDFVISLDDELEVLQILQDIKTKQIFGAYLKNNSNERVYSQDSKLWFDMGLLSIHGKEKADALKKENQLEHNEIFAKMLGITIDSPLFFNSYILEEQMHRIVSNPKYFLIGINSGSGGRWESKKLPIEQTIILINHLLDSEINGKKTFIYLLGGVEEQERHRQIISNTSSERLKDAGTKNTILEFAAIVRAMDYIITSDSLALHLAIAQRKKNLSFFAPTSADEIGTFGSGVKIISTSSDYCNYAKDADNSSITAERILQAFKEHING